MCTVLAKKAALVGAVVAISGLVELSTVPSNLMLIWPRGSTSLSGAPKGKLILFGGWTWPLLSTTDADSPDGFGSTEAEMTELTMLPAMRPLICPPFCARGSIRAVEGEILWFEMVGG